MSKLIPYNSRYMGGTQPVLFRDGTLVRRHLRHCYYRVGSLTHVSDSHIRYQGKRYDVTYEPTGTISPGGAVAYWLAVEPRVWDEPDMLRSVGLHHV